MEDKHIYKPQSKTDLKSLFKRVKGSINDYVKESGIEDLPFAPKPAGKPVNETKITKSGVGAKVPVEVKKETPVKKEPAEVKDFTEVWSQYKPDPRKIPEETKTKIVTVILLTSILLVLAFAIIYAQKR